MHKIFALGLHKTGSTTLQGFLLANQVQLARQGILYPPVTPAALSRFMAEMTDRQAQSSPARLNEVMAHNALAYRLLSEDSPDHPFPEVHRPMFGGQIALAMVQDMAETLRAQSLIFCSEDFARAAFHAPDVPARFSDRFGRDDVTIMATVRRPDDAIAAWQAQKLNFAMPFGALSDTGLGEYLGSVHVDYRRALEPWIDAFPGARVRFTPYTATLAIGGAARQFARTCDLPADLSYPDNSNVSLPHAFIGLSRQGFDDLTRRDASLLREYLKTAATRVPHPSNDTVDLFTSSQRQQLQRVFTPIHDWLGQTSGQTPFFDDLDEIARPRPLSEAEALATILPALKQDAETHLKHAAVLDYLRRL